MMDNNHSINIFIAGRVLLVDNLAQDSFYLKRNKEFKRFVRILHVSASVIFDYREREIEGLLIT